MKTITDIPKMQEFSRQVRLGGLTVGFVPTMGYLHDGHLQLVRRARAESDVVVVSIFVNPTQFNDPKDFESYPRDDAADDAALEREGVDILFRPRAEDVYRSGSSTTVRVEELGDTLCGPGRPGHFDGVATVVASLFNMVGPDVAVFGEKDFQQLQIVRRMAADLHLPVLIVGAPTAREADGLAMSSRNARLGDAERAKAPAIQRGLRAAADAFVAGETDVRALVDCAGSVIEAERGGGAPLEIEYLEVVDAATLKPCVDADENSVIAAAVVLGDVRLIDNIPFARAVKEAAALQKFDETRMNGLGTNETGERGVATDA
jgi:pantoate--beta-alanine ligase